MCPFIVLHLQSGFVMAQLSNRPIRNCQHRTFRNEQHWSQSIPSTLLYYISVNKASIEYIKLHQHEFVMGQKCCSPAMRMDPKHTHLLTLIYTEAQENVKSIDYNEIKEYLAKRGHVRMLGDYLSSHLSQLVPSIAYCKNIHTLARGRDLKGLLFLCCVTCEILHRIARVSQEGKLIQTMKTGNTKKSTSSSDYQVIETALSKSKHESKRERVKQSVQKLKSGGKKPVKGDTVSEYQYEEVNYNLLEIANELLKQTIISREILEKDKPIEAYDTRIQMAAYNILVSVSNLLKNALSQEGNMVKVNYPMIKELLDSFIFTLMMSKKESTQQEKTQFRIKRFGSIASPMKNPIKSQRESRDFQIGINGKPQSQVQISKLRNLMVNDKQIDVIRQLTVQIYYLLLKKANLHLAGGSINKDIIKNHMPRFLQYWTDLMIESDDHIFEKGKSLTNKPEDSDSEDSKQFNNTQSLIQAIMHEFFNNFFSVRESDFIYREFVAAYDRIAFNKSKIRLIERFLFKVLRNYELRSSFISRLFDSLINYLGIIASSPAQVNQNILNDSRDFEKKIEFLNFNPPEIMHYLNEIGQSLNFVNDRAEYVNWHKEENIVGCLQTVHRWMDSDEVDVDDIITYKRTKLFVAVLANLSWGSRPIGEEIYKLIRYLIEKDVRCFGYLMDTSIYIIKRVKTPVGDFHDQKTWETFIDGWKKYNSGLFKMKSAQNQFNRFGEQNGLRPKSNIKRLNTLQSNVETIPVQKFVDEVISVASFPFLGDILMNKGFELPNLAEESLRRVHSGSQTKMENRTTQIGAHKENQLRSSLHKKQQLKATSLRELAKQDLKRSISARDAIRQSKIVEQNVKEPSKTASIYAHIFEEVIQILLKGIEIMRPKIYYMYQVKLASLVITSNFIVMSQIVESVNKKGFSDWLFSMVGKINKFLSNIYKEIDILNSSGGVDASMLQMDIEQENENLYNSHLNQSKDLASSQQNMLMKDKGEEINKVALIDSAIVRSTFNSINKWFYPALTESLVFPTCIEERQAEITTELMSPKHENNLRILLGICVKIYFQNLVNLAIDNYYHQGIRSDHSIEQPHTEGLMNPNSLYPQPRYEKPSSRSEGNIAIKGTQSKVYFVAFYEIYGIFLVFHKKYETKMQQSNIKNMKSTMIETSNSSNSKQKFKQTALNDDLQKLVARIKASLDKLKRNEILMKQSKIKGGTKTTFLRQRKSSSASNFLDGIPTVQQQEFDIDQKSNTPDSQTNYNQEALMDECNQIVQDSNLCKYMFIFVETISEFRNDSVDETVKETQKKACVSKVTEHYFKKDQSGAIKFEDKQESENCFCFKKSNKKSTNGMISKADNLTKAQQVIRQAGKVQKKGSNSEILKPKKGENAEISDLTVQNCAVLTPKIIESYSSLYKFQILGGANQQKGRNSFKPKVFSNLTDHDFRAENSVIDTSHMKTESAETNSFHQIFEQVQQH